MDIYFIPIKIEKIDIKKRMERVINFISRIFTSSKNFCTIEISITLSYDLNIIVRPTLWNPYKTNKSWNYNRSYFLSNSMILIQNVYVLVGSC